MCIRDRSYPWDGGPSYVVCPRARLGFARRNFSTYKHELPLLTAHFTNCVSGWPLYNCYDPNHPTTRSEDKKLKVQLFQYISDEMKLIIGSEVGSSFLVPYTHYFMSMNQNGPRQCISTPLWNLVYHGAINCYWYEGESYNRPGFRSSYDYAEKFLYDLLCGQPSQWNFYMSDYKFWRERLKETYQLLSKLSEAIAYEEMIDHKFLTEDYFVQKSMFSGGTEIYINLRDRDYQENDLSIPARGFHVKNSPIGTFKGQLTGPILATS